MSLLSIFALFSMLILNSDVAGLLVLIFVQKALDVKQNEKEHMLSPQKVYIFIMFLSQNSESDKKAVDIKQNAACNM